LMANMSEKIKNLSFFLLEFYTLPPLMNAN
jgi:hypothetical protein